MILSVTEKGWEIQTASPPQAVLEEGCQLPLLKKEQPKHCDKVLCSDDVVAQSVFVLRVQLQKDYQVFPMVHL